MPGKFCPSTLASSLTNIKISSWSDSLSPCISAFRPIAAISFTIFVLSPARVPTYTFSELISENIISSICSVVRGEKGDDSVNRTTILLSDIVALVRVNLISSADVELIPGVLPSVDYVIAFAYNCVILDFFLYTMASYHRSTVSTHDVSRQFSFY